MVDSTYAEAYIVLMRYGNRLAIDPWKKNMSAGIRFFAFVMSFLALGWTADRSALGTGSPSPRRSKLPDATSMSRPAWCSHSPSWTSNELSSSATTRRASTCPAGTIWSATVHDRCHGVCVPDSQEQRSGDRCSGRAFPRSQAGHHGRASGRQTAPGRQSQSHTGQVAKTGLHALFRLTQPTTAGPQMSRSEAFLFTHGKWFIKYRLTYPEAHAEQCARISKAFMETLKWPEGS